MRLTCLGLICGGVLVLGASTASAESEPLPPCFSPDGFPGAVFPDFVDGPSIPANAPAIPLFAGPELPRSAEFVDGNGDPVTASLQLDDVLPWVMVVPDSLPLRDDTLAVTFEDACRVELEAAQTQLRREFILTDEAPLPEQLDDVRFDDSIIGEGCETLRAIQVDVTLPSAFVPWRTALTTTLAAIPTGEAADNPIYQGVSVTTPYVLRRPRVEEPDQDADTLTLTHYISPQCTNQELPSFLAPGEYELEFTAHIAGTETTLGPASGVLVVPESACAPCSDVPGAEPDEDEGEPTPPPDEASEDNGDEAGCRVGGSGGLPGAALVLLVLGGRRLRTR